MDNHTNTHKRTVPKNWDEETRSEIVSLRKDGISIPAIAAIVRKSSRDVSLFLREQGIGNGQRCDAWTQEEDETVRENLDKKYPWLMARLPGRTYFAVKNRVSVIKKRQQPSKSSS